MGNFFQMRIMGGGVGRGDERPVELLNATWTVRASYVALAVTNMCSSL
jgi:hypothetical protein